MNNEFSFESVIGRLKKVLAIETDSSIAEALGLSTGAFGNRKKAGSVPYEQIIAVAGKRNLNLDYIFTGKELKYPVAEGCSPLVAGERSKNDDLVAIPCRNVKGSAGPGNHIHDEEIAGHFEISRAWVRNVLNCEPGKVDIIFVDGPSMEPTLEDGELVLVDRRCDRFDNDAVYAIQYDGKLRIKRVQLRFDGSVMVKSDNSAFDPEVLTGDQAEHLRVIGKVLPWKFGKYKL